MIIRSIEISKSLLIIIIYTLGERKGVEMWLNSQMQKKLINPNLMLKMLKLLRVGTIVTTGSRSPCREKSRKSVQSQNHSYKKFLQKQQG